MVFAAAMTQNALAGEVWLTMDQVRPLNLKKEAFGVVVGNPSIADVKVMDANNILLFGKAPGLTNIYLFGEDDKPFENLIIRVRTPSSDMLTVHRGSARTTYNCTSNCEATLTVGDDPASFDGVTAQVQSKVGQAVAAAGSE